MAIDDLLDEHEQSERVLAWLRANGAGLVGGVALGLALILGWQWWGGQQAASKMKAGDDYQAVLKSIEGKDLKKAQSQASALAGTTYATLAAFDIAKSQVESGQRDAAIATLKSVKPTDAGMQSIANQRLARLLLDAGKHEEVLTVLGAADDAASQELRGDAQALLGKQAEARTSYSAALARIDVASPQHRLVELKLIAVGGVPAKPEART